VHPPRRYPSDLAPDDSLWPFATVVDATLAAAGGDAGAVVRLTGRPDPAVDPPDALGWFPLVGGHPLDVLLGFAAPPEWWAIGVSCAGRAHPTVGPAADVRITVLIDRTGGAAGLLRRHGEVSPLPGAPGGVVADACRRAIGLPTAPPPDTTTELWTLLWLDRVVARAAAAGVSAPIRTWSQLAALHPAAAGRPSGRADQPVSPLPVSRMDAAGLAASARALAAAWSWSRLRDEPDAFDLPGGLRTSSLAGWMDDGMWARWLLSSLPATDDLLDAATALLPAALADPLATVVRTTHGDGGR
jgi:hypothetical protein